MEAAQRYYDECLELARAGGDRREIANALYNDSFPANVTKADLPKARVLLEEALPMFREMGDDPGIARCLWALGQVNTYEGKDEAAILILDEAIDIFRRLGVRFDLGWALFVRGVAALKLNDVAGAKSRAMEALRIFAVVNDVTAAVLLLESLAEVARREGDAIRGARLAGAAAAQAVSSGVGLGSIVSSREGWRSAEPLNEAEAEARAEGEAMTLTDAMTYALSGADQAGAGRDGQAPAAAGGAWSGRDSDSST